MSRALAPLLKDYADLAKVRMQVFAVGTAIACTWLAGGQQLGAGLALGVFAGLVLVCSGASAFNQLLEIVPDGRMVRTRNRPLPAGRIGYEAALTFALITSVAGVALLTYAVNPLTGLLALSMLVLYDFVYTPLKRVTSLNTLVGAIPGAMPVLIGWAAAGNGLNQVAWALFGILFVWQLPHFLAIAWIHREDYERGGMKMLPVVHPEGSVSQRQAVLYAATLVPVSLLPALSADSGPLYFFGALILSLVFLAYALGFLLSDSLMRARSLMRASLLYLPLLLVLLLVDAAGAVTF